MAANIENIFRLTSAQQGILYHCLQGGTGSAYHTQYGCKYIGINEEILRKSWTVAFSRHEVLRSLFTWEKRDKPLQLVRREVELPWYEADWRDLDDNEQQRRWDSYLLRDRDRGFDLEKAPLVRLALFRTSAQEFRFSLSFHHIVLDGWSLRLILEDVASIYRSLAAGT